MDTASSSRAAGRTARPKPKRGPAPGPGIPQATADLARYFTGGDFNPGDVVPSVAELREKFSLSQWAVRGALKELSERGVIVTAKGRRSTLAQAETRHTLVRDADDPTRHLRPIGEPHNIRQYANLVTAELFDVRDDSRLNIHEQTYEHRTTGTRVHTARTIPADVTFVIEPEPDPFGDRTELKTALAAHYGPLETRERYRFILKPTAEIRTDLELEPGTPVVEQRRFTRAATGRLLMVESEVTDATSAEWEHRL